MVKYDYYERLACSYCGSEFNDNWVEEYEHLSEASCPICREKGYLHHMFNEQCAECGETLGMTNFEVFKFKGTHSDGDSYSCCFSICEEKYYLHEDKLYCENCWEKLLSARV